MNNIKVSICCITYNHEKYIKDALDGFLNQKTDFEYEILIHDDASQDKTADIIREYHEKYPDKIRPILQTENQYSKGKRIFPNFLYPIVRGQFVALCEGDDYWIDSLKLQKQVDYMEKNKNCTLTFHNAEILDQMTGETTLFLKEDNDNRIYKAGELAIKGFVPTASMMFKAESIEKFPRWLHQSIVGDYPLLLINSSFGNAYYFKDVMSVYRTNVPGSATSRFSQKSDLDQIKYLNGFIEILDNFNDFTYKKYQEDIEVAKIPWQFSINFLKRDKQALKNPKYREYLSKQPLGFKLRYQLRLKMPILYDLLKKFKH